MATAAVVSLFAGCGTGITVRLEAKGAPLHKEATTYFWFSTTVAILSGVIGLVYLSSAFPAAPIRVMFATGFLFVGFTYTAQYSEFTQALGRLGVAVMSPVIYVATTGVVGLLFVILDRGELFGILLAACVAQFLQFAVLALVAVRHYGRGPMRPLWGDIVKLPMRGAPALGTNLGLAVMQRGIRVILPFVIPTHIIGFIAAASVLAELQRILPNAFARVVFVELSRSGRWTREAQMASIFAVSSTAVVATVLILFGAEALDILFGQAYAGAQGYLPWLVALEGAMAMTLVSSRAAIALGGVRRVALLCVTVAAACVVIAIGFASILHATGIIAVFIAGNLVSLGGSVVITYRRMSGRERR